MSLVFALVPGYLVVVGSKLKVRGDALLAKYAVFYVLLQLFDVVTGIRYFGTASSQLG